MSWAQFEAFSPDENEAGSPSRSARSSRRARAASESWARWAGGRPLRERLRAATGSPASAASQSMNVEQKAVDVFSAIDVLDRGAAECQGNTYLYTAFARALGIPTRVVKGLVYTENAAGHGGGFVYHTWAESVVDGRWRAVDATFGQPVADATHVKLVEGENLADLAVIVPLIGRLDATAYAVRY